jgi:thymidylate synthase
MKVFQGNSADAAWRSAAQYLRCSEETSARQGRGGDTAEVLHAVFTIDSPRDRWVLSRSPAINPAFAIAEVVWILNGREDSKFLSFFNSQLYKYVGDDDSCYGAYGYRLRRNFECDQLAQAYDALANNPTTRQVVLQIWDANKDLPNGDGSARGSDIPCNVVSMLKIHEGALEWMQVMRSNDIFRGTPYNFIQFTYLQEIMAGWLGLRVGSYGLLSDSLHVYSRDIARLSKLDDVVPSPNTDLMCSSKDVSDLNFKLLAEHVDTLIEHPVENEALARLNNSALAPEYHNLFCVLLAEIARRKGWRQLVQLSIDQCTNPILKQAWDRWDRRVGKLDLASSVGMPILS